MFTNFICLWKIFDKMAIYRCFVTPISPLGHFVTNHPQIASQRENPVLLMHIAPYVYFTSYLPSKKYF